MLRQILLNLISNALNVTNKDMVRIRIEGIEKNMAQAILAFKIEGLENKITENKLNEIFSYFTQDKSSYVPTYDYSKLWLTITKAYIESMGGTIIIENYSGNSHTINCTIPFQLPLTNDITPTQKATNIKFLH